MLFLVQLNPASNNTYSLYAATILTHYRMFVCILLRNKPLLLPKWRQKPIVPFSTILRRAMEEFKFTNFENSYEINKNSYEDDNFLRSGDISKKYFWGVSGTWIANI